MSNFQDYAPFVNANCFAQAHLIKTVGDVVATPV